MTVRYNLLSINHVTPSLQQLNRIVVCMDAEMELFYKKYKKVEALAILTFSRRAKLCCYIAPLFLHMIMIVLSTFLLWFVFFVLYWLPFYLQCVQFGNLNRKKLLLMIFYIIVSQRGSAIIERIAQIRTKKTQLMKWNNNQRRVEVTLVNRLKLFLKNMTIEQSSKNCNFAVYCASLPNCRNGGRCGFSFLCWLTRVLLGIADLIIWWARSGFKAQQR